MKAWNSRFSRAVSWSSSDGSWKTSPIRCLTAAGSCMTSMPATRAMPAVGVSNVQSMEMVVDLPAPLGPRNPKISPPWTSRSIPATATRSPYFLIRPLASIAVSATLTPYRAYPRRPRNVAHPRPLHPPRSRPSRLCIPRGWPRRGSETNGSSRFDGRRAWLGAKACDLACDLRRLLQSLARLDEPFHQADAQRLFGIHLPPGQDEVQRATLSDHPRQANRAEVDQGDAKAAVEDAERRVASGDADV